MKLIVTGSLGNISKSRAEILIAQGYEVTVVSSVSPKDITDAEELLSTPENKTICFVGSEELNCNEAARIIGTVVGKPWLK